MNSNVGNLDKIIRIVLALILGSLYLTGKVSGGLGVAALVVAAVLVLTSLFSFCPLYRVLGLSSCPRK
jgi:hypothetical protein